MIIYCKSITDGWNYSKMKRLLGFLLLLELFLYSCQAVKVTQNVPMIMVKTGEKVEIPCQHDDTTGAYNMYWYQQKPGEGMKLMAVSVGVTSPDMEKEFTGKWNMTRPDTINSRLIKENTKAEDMAVYFCASAMVEASYNQLYFGQGTVLSVLGEKEKQIEPKVRIFPPDKQEFIEHGLISVVCVASGFFPEHVRLTWYLNNEKIESLYQNVPKSDADNTYSTSSRLSLMESQYFNPDTKIRCEARFVGSDNSTSDEIDGELGCGVSKESYGRYMNQGKISYIMVLFKSGLYAVIVVAVIWRRKALSGSC